MPGGDTKADKQLENSILHSVNIKLYADGFLFRENMISFCYSMRDNFSFYIIALKGNATYKCHLNWQF